MRNLLDDDPPAHYRLTGLEIVSVYGSTGNAGNGVFEIPSPIDRATLRVIASDGAGWDHVSVSRRNRCPNWVEMQFVKRLFFRDDEVAMQLHVEEREHISHHPFCLHLWKPRNGVIPLPPSFMVAPREEVR